MQFLSEMQICLPFLDIFGRSHLRPRGHLWARIVSFRVGTVVHSSRWRSIRSTTHPDSELLENGPQQTFIFLASIAEGIIAEFELNPGIWIFCALISAMGRFLLGSNGRSSIVRSGQATFHLFEQIEWIMKAWER